MYMYMYMYMYIYVCICTYIFIYGVLHGERRADTTGREMLPRLMPYALWVCVRYVGQTPWGERWSRGCPSPCV